MAPDHADDHIRVGNAERERAIALLNDAFSGGYLEIVEFEDRSEAVYAAKTRGDLRVVLEHLPLAGHLFPDSPVVAAALPTQAPVVPAGPVQLNAEWETVRRKGVWSVPPNILVTGSMGTIDLDFTNATLPGPLVNVQLQVSTSTVKLRVGADQEIRYSELDKSGWSSIKDKGGPPVRPGGSVINVSGSISAMTGVTIKRSAAPTSQF
ncbi:MAG: hypothetical protein C0482_17850 [Gordonia sp.]|uniref:DUF1707 domain-containing protein n=1 Tax=Gordonia rubripertincta TaxID=36822 RepID=A0ABT4MN71_GORRU|nr:DUF1707 domain-containing protein [Gordonia rubripertincta]MBA4024222.1 hypothetical protein [Gordonia sp. (in: high G+C Gram-positive bacteria)]MCZ4548447.1 DUF1707 domain-containing protein [Gordonia rubripertincta]